MMCQCCGNVAPTKSVAFYQNIGVLVIRFTSTMEGELCKTCIHSTFWKMTAINLTLGWWGIISFIVNIFFILNNLFYYLGALGMEAPAPDAAPPQLLPDTVKKLTPHTEEIISRLNNNEDFQRVANDIAMRASCSTGEVVAYVRALVAQAQQEQRY